MLAVMERDNPMPLAHASADNQHSQSSLAIATEWQCLAIEKEHEDVLLCQLAGTTSLSDITALQAVINTTTSTVSHLGSKLPQLQELNLNGSVLPSIRDLGTTFQQLRVLWVSRCGLLGLEGIASLPALQELYCSYNDITDVQPLTLCQELQVLDLEGNCVTDLDSLDQLGACTNLQSLTLTGNPVDSQPGSRRHIAALLPGLQYLNDMAVDAACNEQDETAEGCALDIQPALSATASAASGMIPKDRPNCSDTQGSNYPTSATAQQTESCQPPNELDLVLHGIKHARVGVDSDEYRQIEASNLIGFAQGQSEPNCNGIMMPSQAPSQGPSSASSSVVTPQLSDNTRLSTAMLLPAARPSSASAVSLLPQSTGGWLRSLRSSLPMPDDNSLQQGCLWATPPAAEHSNRSASSMSDMAACSPQTSRPTSTATSVRDSAASRNHDCCSAIASPQLSQRPSSTSKRPFSARIGTAGNVNSTGTRPGTGASQSATGTGLYWSKHRITTPVTSLLPDTDPAQGMGQPVDPDDRQTSSSALTFGGDAIGGSLARDLRRRRKGSAGSTGASKFSARSSVQITSSSITVYDAKQLLEELKAWKLDSADRSLLAEDTSVDMSNSNEVWSGCQNSLINTIPASDVLDLSLQPNVKEDIADGCVKDRDSNGHNHCAASQRSSWPTSQPRPRGQTPSWQAALTEHRASSQHSPAAVNVTHSHHTHPAAKQAGHRPKHRTILSKVLDDVGARQWPTSTRTMQKQSVASNSDAATGNGSETARSDALGSALLSSRQSHASSGSGEIDLMSVNPRPISRIDPDSDTDCDT